MDKHCANCIYRCYITAGLYCCDYIGCTGHARSLICPPGARCTEKKTVQRTPPNPNGRPKAVFDEATCMQLYQKGMSDIKIGKHFGLSKNPIVKAKLFCPEIAGLFCRIAGLFCHDSRANLSLKPVCFGIAIS